MKRFLIIAALALAACVTTDSEIPPGPAAFRAGYGDGCNSGLVAAGHPYYRFTKDTYRYDEDRLYRQGWNDGMTICKGEYDAIRNAMRR